MELIFHTECSALVADFKQQNIHHIHLITSDFHLSRAKAIAFLVLGSQGITYTLITLTTDRKPKSKLRIARDLACSYFWIITKHTGSSLNRRSKFIK